MVSQTFQQKEGERDESVKQRKIEWTSSLRFVISMQNNNLSNADPKEKINKKKSKGSSASEG